jgi:hypothetical protein
MMIDLAVAVTYLNAQFRSKMFLIRPYKEYLPLPP